MSSAFAVTGVAITPATGGASISADTNAATGSGAYTTLTGPVLVENNPGGVSATGTIILTVPSGFEFDTTANAVTATVTPAPGKSCSGTRSLLLNGAMSQIVTATSTTITINVSRVSTPSHICQITYSGIRVRPTSGSPIASGNITPSGTASIVEDPVTTNYGSLAMAVGAPNKLAFIQQPTNTVAGVVVSPSVTVQVQDLSGNAITTAANAITVAIGTNPGSGTLSGTVTVNASSGLATFSTLSIDKAGVGYTLTATAAGLTGATSNAFNITPAAANRLAFSTQPSNTLANATMSNVVVQIQDAFGNLVSSASGNITVAIGTNPAGGTLSGTLTVATSGGAATFSTLSINNAGAGYTLTAAAAGLTGATSAGFNILVAVTAFDAVEVAAARATNIYTKLAGTAFSLDILALDASNNLATTYTGTVTIHLVDGASGAGVCSAMTLLQNYGSFTYLGAEAGRKTIAITYANAAPNARIRINDASAGVTGCSTDNFSIRPLSITGVTSNMTNTGTSGAPRAVAGSGVFTLAATTGLTGYTGTPKVDNNAVQAHVNAVQNGSLTGVFPTAVAGTSTGTNAFTYSEVGNFRFLGFDPASNTASARGVYDDTFTAVDAGDCTNDFSNSPVGGKYGCKFGITANTNYFGRFYPASFAVTPVSVTNRRLLACVPASTFTYAGEELQVRFILTARNGAGTPATTQNYDPAAGFASFDGTTIANFNFGAIDLADATPPTSATALTTNLGLVSSSGTWIAGSATFTANLKLNRAAAAEGPFESFSLGIAPSDADSVILGSYNLDTTVPANGNDRGLVGTAKIRHGRMRIPNMYGSNLLALPIPLSAQYWNGSGYVINVGDGCTPIAVANFSVTAGAGGVINTTVTGSGAVASGAGVVSLSKPVGFTSKGSVDVTSLLPYLPGTGRETFGIYKGGPLIYFREVY